MKKSLPYWLKFLYGSGDGGIASIGWLRGLFYALYLTDVVGLEPRLASFGALVGLGWDAINDPIIGILSDRLKSKLGRRRPFLLWFAIPFGISFIILWSAPQWENQLALLAYVTLAFMLSDTLTTLVAVPYYALTPDLTADYDERTELSSIRTVFQLIGAIAVIVAAPTIVDMTLENGGTQQQGFMLAGAIFGGIGAVPLMLIGAVVREKFIPVEEETLSFIETLRITWKNIPFRYAAGIYMFNWSAVDMIIIAFPYFLLYWISSGDPLLKVPLLGINFPIESAFFGITLVVCIIFAPFWQWFSRMFNKKAAYIWGMSLWVIIQALIFTIQPGAITYLLVIAALAGIGISAAYIIPDSMLPDVIEWDELHTGKRQEGIYYGIRTLIRKLTGALVSFITLQVLGWSGYHRPENGIPFLDQPDSVMIMIRLMASIFGAIMLIGTIIAAWNYPLSREKYERVARLLERKRSEARKEEIRKKKELG